LLPQNLLSGRFASTSGSNRGQFDGGRLVVLALEVTSVVEMVVAPALSKW
jgi:hypothetical protein